MEIPLDATLQITQVCSDCKGSKVVPNPSWEEFRRLLKAGQVTEDKMEDWFRQRGEAVRKTHMGTSYWALPSKEDTCGECEGTGRVCRSVTLRELAAAIKGV
jgi:hypothetical protein